MTKRIVTLGFTRVAGGGIWLRQESLRHILASPPLPWENRGKCHMDGKRIQCLSNASQHVPIFLQLFPTSQYNSTRKFKSSPF